MNPKVRVIRTAKTRPADTTAYAANDAICESASAGTVWTFPQAARGNGGTGTILGARLATSDTTNTAVMSLDLYNASITAINDNAEATRLVVNDDSYVGTVTFTALAKPTANSTVADNDAGQIRIPFQLPTSQSNLYGILRTAAFTPVSAASYAVTLRISQD